MKFDPSQISSSSLAMYLTSCSEILPGASYVKGNDRGCFFKCTFSTHYAKKPFPYSVLTPLLGAPPSTTDIFQGVDTLSNYFSVLSLGCLSNAQVTDLYNIKSLLVVQSSWYHWHWIKSPYKINDHPLDALRLNRIMGNNGKNIKLGVRRHEF